MQKELQELQPVLAATAQQVETMMTVIASDKEEAATTRLQVGTRGQPLLALGVRRWPDVP